MNRPFITPYAGHHPQIAADAWVDPMARIIGKVKVGAKASIWPGAVLRADDAEIEIGEGSAVLDLALIEAPLNKPVIIAPGALISHQACVHGATVMAGALVGIGAIVLDGATVGEGSLIGGGALVPPGMQVPAGVLVLGTPGKVVRELKESERKNILVQLLELEEKGRIYLKEL